ncbi:MAG TPA: glutaredoxin family protein [Steroidobacteraceae bacterium]|nr:glutaredoxin family protein [Steroidobacteraceae bacterium]
MVLSRTRARRREGLVVLTVVHRRECALCEEMLAELRALAQTMPLPPIEVVDVDSDPVLERRHGLDVPVLLLDGTVVCRHRLDAGELKRLLRGH